MSQIDPAEIRQLLLAYLDDELAPDRRSRVAEALKQSASLRAELDQLRQTSERALQALRGHRLKAEAEKLAAELPADEISRMLREAGAVQVARTSLSQRGAALVPERPRLLKRLFPLAVAAAALAIVTAASVQRWAANRRVNQYVTVATRTALVPEAPAAVHLVVRDGRHEPLAGREVGLRLVSSSGETSDLGRFSSNDSGAINANFRMPAVADGAYRLVARADDGMELAVDDITVGAQLELLLASDKPTYQPGQAILLRALAREQGSGRPLSGASLRFEVRDPDDNVIFRRHVGASRFGIASTEMQLIDEPKLGQYRLRVTREGAREVTAENSVRVERYKLPAYRVDAGLVGGRRWALAGEQVEVEIRARYLFGKPVTGGSYRIALGGVPSELRGALARADFEGPSGKLDAEGRATARVRLPALPLPDQPIALPLLVTVTDRTGDREMGLLQLKLANAAVVPRIVPIGGAVAGRAGLAQPVVISTTAPDGAPVAADVTLIGRGGSSRKLRTSALGLARTELDCSQGWELVARGELGEASWRFEPDDFERRAVLLKTDKSYVSAGETIELRALGHEGPLLIDITSKERTFVSTGMLCGPEGGKVDLALPGSLKGVATVSAYRMSGMQLELVGSLPLFVEPATELAIEATLRDSSGAISDAHRPGERASYRLALRDRQGAPVTGALSLSIVDEAVLARAASLPGLVSVAAALSREADLLGDESDPRAATAPALAAARQVSMRMAAGQEKTAEDDRQAATALLLSQQRSASVSLPSRILNDLHIRGTHLRAARRMIDRIAALSYVILPLGLLAWGFCLFPVIRLPLIIGGGGLALLATMMMTLSGGLKSAASGSLRAGVTGAAPEYDAATAGIGAEGMPQASQQLEAFSERLGALRSEVGGERPRTRRRFVETLRWIPQLITDDEGNAELPLELADNITGWRTLIEAIDADGRVGSMQTSFRTFQPLFVKADTPLQMVAGDEIEVPIGVFNYGSARGLELKLAVSGGLELIGAARHTLELEADSQRGMTVRLRAARHGIGKLTLEVRGGDGGDALEEVIPIQPDGDRVTGGRSGRLRSEAIQIEAPRAPLPGTLRGAIEIYPGVVSEIQRGLEAMLRMPTGCFEQSSSSNYPNLLIARYLKASGQYKSEVALALRALLERGLAKLLTFHDGSGGFAMYPGQKAQPRLGAYALMQLSAAREFIDVSPTLITKVASRLTRDLGKTKDRTQRAYGAWALAEASDGGRWPRMDGRVIHPSTLRRALEAQLSNLGGQKRLTSYQQALLLQAEVAFGRPAAADRLAKLIGGPDRDGLWTSGGDTVMGGQGPALELETSALILRAASLLDRVDARLRAGHDALIAARSSEGLWGTTQSTCLALMALTAAAERESALREPLTVRVKVNGAESGAPVVIKPADRDVVRRIPLKGLRSGGNTIELIAPGQRLPLTYRVAWQAYVSRDNPGERALGLDVRYDRKRLPLGERTDVELTVTNRAPRSTGALIIELPLPANAEPTPQSLAALLQDGVDRHERRGAELVLYLTDLPPGQARKLTLSLRASRRGTTSAAPARAWVYYTPERQTTGQGVTLVVD